MTDVYLHIGLPKTGTTSIQWALQENAEPLAEHGVVFAGGRHHVQRRAMYDFMGRRIEGNEAHDIAGSFEQFVDEIDASTARTVVVSEELLTVARRRQVRKLVKALDTHRVFVVVGVRDLGRSIPSAWQQEIIKGHTFTWREYLAAIRDPALGPATAGVAFRLRFDLLRILDTWEQSVPRERIRLVTVPPPGSPPELLLDRFSEAIGVPAGVLRGQRQQRNESLGAVEIEALRRLNTTLRSNISHAQHIAVVQRTVRPALAGRESRRLALDDRERPWVTQRTETLVAELTARGYEVHGHLTDLDPHFAGTGERSLDDVTEAELLTPTEDALLAVSLAYASLWKRHQRLKGRREGEASTGTRLTSSARAAGFGVRMAALDRADRNRFMAWLARTYVGRSSRS